MKKFKNWILATACNYVQNSGRFDEGFKDKLKKFGKKAALAGMLGLASLNGVSCANGSGDDDSYIEEESQEPEKTYTCSECGSQFDNESDANSVHFKHGKNCSKHTYHVGADDIKTSVPDCFSGTDNEFSDENNDGICDMDRWSAAGAEAEGKLHAHCRNPYCNRVVYDDNEDGSVEDELAAHESEKYFKACPKCGEKFHTCDEKVAHTENCNG